MLYQRYPQKQKRGRRFSASLFSTLKLYYFDILCTRSVNRLPPIADPTAVMMVPISLSHHLTGRCSMAVNRSSCTFSCWRCSCSSSSYFLSSSLICTVRRCSSSQTRSRSCIRSRSRANRSFCTRIRSMQSSELTGSAIPITPYNILVLRLKIIGYGLRHRFSDALDIRYAQIEHRTIILPVPRQILDRLKI